MAAPTTLTKTTTGQIAPDNLVPILNNAATKHGIPLSVLTGVLGMETNFGKNVATSSAGAVGLFQFLPSTAASYGYPLTNSPTIAQAQQQADAAAQYLSDLFRQYGNWNTALQHYSGGGYGLPQVSQKAQTNIPANEAVASNILPSPSISNPVSGLEQIATLLTSSAFWIRLGEALAGILLLAMGLRSLTGTTATPATVARKVVKHAL